MVIRPTVFDAEAGWPLGSTWELPARKRGGKWGVDAAVPKTGFKQTAQESRENGRMSGLREKIWEPSQSTELKEEKTKR